MNLREIGIGKAFVFQREGVTIRAINESTSFSNKAFTTLKSQYGQRGLVYDIDETWIFFIGADTKYYKIENTETNKEAIFVVETLEEAKSLGSNDLPPKEESLFRRVPQQLIAQEVVSVQPMSAPVGSLFYLDYQYQDGDSIEQIQNDNNKLQLKRQATRWAFSNRSNARKLGAVQKPSLGKKRRRNFC